MFLPETYSSLVVRPLFPSMTDGQEKNHLFLLLNLSLRTLTLSLQLFILYLRKLMVILGKSMNSLLITHYQIHSVPKHLVLTSRTDKLLRSSRHSLHLHKQNNGVMFLVSMSTTKLNFYSNQVITN